MNIEDAKQLTPFELELLRQLHDIVLALKALKEDI